MPRTVAVRMRARAAGQLVMRCETVAGVAARDAVAARVGVAARASVGPRRRRRSGRARSCRRSRRSSRPMRRTIRCARSAARCPPMPAAPSYYGCCATTAPWWSAARRAAASRRRRRRHIGLQAGCVGLQAGCPGLQALTRMVAGAAVHPRGDGGGGARRRGLDCGHAAAAHRCHLARAGQPVTTSAAACSHVRQPAACSLQPVL